MEHLQQPQNPFSRYPVIKCICAVDDYQIDSFRIRSFSTFKCTKEDFTSGPSKAPSLNTAAPFLQAWLWYGLLEGVFNTVGVAFHPSDFVVKDISDGLRLSTLHLHRYLWYWVAAESPISDTERKRHCKSINRYLDEVFDALQCYTVKDCDPNSPQFQDMSTFGPFLDDNASNILLAIVVIAEALDFAQESIYRDFQEGRLRAWDESLGVRLSLLDAGWCIKEVSWLTNQFTTSHVTILVYLSRIDRRIFTKDHSCCTIDSCKYEKIDYNTYRPIHIKPECHCSDITLMYSSCKRMDLFLCKGNIPLLTFAANEIFGSQLDVQRFSVGRTETTYVAISHVWSDRLGNLQENALPACQLQRLQSEVNALYPSHRADIPFWIDTICVPRERTTKNLAIKSMRNVYERADKVLVLDSSLRTVNSLAAPEELLLRIMVAPWSTRLWTYNEGALASKINFQLKDCAVAGDRIEGRYLSEGGEAASIVKIQELSELGSNGEYERSLVRAMALDENGQEFLDLQREAEKPMSLSVSETGADDVEIGTSENGVNSMSEVASEQSSEDEKDLDVSFDSEDLRRIEAATEASIARTQAVYAEIARLRSETAKILEQTMQKKAEAREWVLKSERLKLNSLGRMSYKQTPPAGLNLDVSKTWLEDTPNSADRHLADTIKMIFSNNVVPRYWLRGFDPIRFEGSFAYSNLRTAFKRLSLNMYTNPVPECEQIREVIAAVRWRTTSWRSDEAVCLGMLLGMDLGKVIEARGEDRMKILASMWQEVPSELVFCGLRRIPGGGFGWMPKSVLGVGLASTGSRRTVKRCQEGVCIKTEGFMFDLTSKVHEDQSLAFRMNETWYMVWAATEDEARSWKDVENGPTAVLFEEDIKEKHFNRSVRGVVAKVVKVEEGHNKIFLNHVLAVRISLADKLNNLVLVHQPRIIIKDQECCIG